MPEDDLTAYDRAVLDGVVGRFGRYLMDRSYDVGVRSAEGTLAGQWKARNHQELARRLEGLTEDERAAVTALARDALVAALHGLLHGVSHDQTLIQVFFEGQDIAR